VQPQVYKALLAFLKAFQLIVNSWQLRMPFLEHRPIFLVEQLIFTLSFKKWPWYIGTLWLIQWLSYRRSKGIQKINLFNREVWKSFNAQSYLILLKVKCPSNSILRSKKCIKQKKIKALWGNKYEQMGYFSITPSKTCA